MAEPFAFDLNDLDLSLDFQISSPTTGLNPVTADTSNIINANSLLNPTSPIPYIGSSPAVTPGPNTPSLSIPSHSSPIVTTTSFNQKNSASTHKSIASPPVHSSSPAMKFPLKSPPQNSQSHHTFFHHNHTVEKPSNRFSTIISSLFNKKRNNNSSSTTSDAANNAPVVSRQLAPAADIVASKTVPKPSISNPNKPLVKPNSRNVSATSAPHTPMTGSLTFSPKSSNNNRFFRSPNQEPSKSQTPHDVTDKTHTSSKPMSYDTILPVPDVLSSSPFLIPISPSISDDFSKLVANTDLTTPANPTPSADVSLNTVTSTPNTPTPSIPIIPSSSKTDPLPKHVSQLSSSAPVNISASLSMLTDSDVDVMLPPVPPIGSLYSPSASPHSTLDNCSPSFKAYFLPSLSSTPSSSSSSPQKSSSVGLMSGRNSAPSIKRSSISDIFLKDSPASVVSTSSSSSNNAQISSSIKPNTRSPLHLSRSSSSSDLSTNNTDKKDSLSKKNSTDSYSTYHISPQRRSLLVSDGTVSPISTFGKALTPSLTSSSLAAAVAAAANVASFPSLSSLSSVSSRSHTPDKLRKPLHNKSNSVNVYAKDEFHAEFKQLDSEFSKFSSKSGVNKANALRLTLLTFLRNQVGDSTVDLDDSDKSQSYNPILSPQNRNKQVQRGGLSPSDLTKRAKIFQKWWNGLLEALKDREHPVAGSDRSAYLEAISGIMSRFEWLELCYDSIPMPSTQTSHSTTDTPGYAASFKSTASLSSFASFAAAAVNYNSSEDISSVHNSPGFTVQPSAVVVSPQSCKIYEKLLYETLTWALNRLSLNTVPVSTSAFAGKVLAHSFFFAPGIAAPLLYLLRVSPVLVDRIVSVSFGDSKQSQTDYYAAEDNKLATLEQSINQMRCFFPMHVSNLVGYTYNSTPSFKSTPTTNDVSSNLQSASCKASSTGSTSTENKSGLFNKKSPFSKKSFITNVFNTRPPSPQQLSALGGDIYGPWVRRWTAFNSDVFHSFLKHYYTILSKIMATTARMSLQKAAFANSTAARVSSNRSSYYFDKKFNWSSGSTGVENTFSQAINPQQFASNVHLAAPGLIVIHAYILGGLDSVVHPPIRPGSGSKFTTQPSSSAAEYNRSVSPPLGSSRARNSSGTNLRVSAIMA